MSLDVGTRSDRVVTPARTHRRRGILLAVIAVFQFWLWGTRIVNMIETSENASAAFVGVHVALYTVAIGVGVVLLVLGIRMFREARHEGVA